MSSQSKADIANIALIKIGSSEVQNLTGDSREVRIINRIYDFVLDTLLQDYTWSFAIKRASLAQLTETPDWGWDYAYAYPQDALRIIEIQDNPDWVQEGNKILSNETELNARYIREITDTTEMPDVFIRAFTDSMASLMAIPLSNRPDIATLFDNMAQRSIRRALKKGAIERKRGEADVPYPSWVKRGRIEDVTEQEESS
jgi:hypothetical protein